MSASSATGSASRTWLGNAAILLVLLMGVLALLPLHDDAWWLAPPRARQWWLAAFATAAYAGFCAWTWRRAHHAAAASTAGADRQDEAVAWLVAYASQTGFAYELARQTASSLRDAGLPVTLLPLSTVDAALLARTRRALFVASTTGEGDAPDPALGFVRDNMGRPAGLDGLQYAVLALGDREYAHYCGFGHRLDHWLRDSHATPLFDLTEVDNGDPGALRHWQHHLGLLAGRPDLPDWMPAQYQAWTLRERELLNANSLGGPAFRLALTPAEQSMPDWRAGDIAEIGPRNASATVDGLLAARGLDGEATVDFIGGRTTLRDALSRARLDDAMATGAGDAQALAHALQPLPHREYSISSLPQDGVLELLVRRMARPDGEPGIGSGWLCEHAAIGERIDLRVRANPNFHPPGSDRPMILVGNGTGIAGLRAHLKARIAVGATRNWLLFGERQQSRDFFHRDELLRWRDEGAIARLDLVFSRDGGRHRYVRDALRAAADELRAWIADGAVIYVCGSLEGMAPGVDAALREALGHDTVDRLRDDGRYRRDVY